MLRMFITDARTADDIVNKHVVYGILIGLIKSDLSRYGGYLDFVVIKGWLGSLYNRMNMSRRMVTTSGPIVTRSLWEEVRLLTPALIGVNFGLLALLGPA